MVSEVSHGKSSDFVLPISLLTVIVAVLLAVPPVLGQAIDRTLGLREIRPGYYVYLHGDDTPGVSSTFNSGIIVTDEGVVVVDALGSESIARQVRQVISGVTSKPIRFLVSSTFHRPFTGGNAVYSDVARIGHEHYRTDLIKLLQSVPAEEREKSLPGFTYSERMTLHLGGKEIQLLHLGRAHTRGDTIVFVPADRIAYLGEVFYSDEFPYMSDGFSADWMRTLEAAEALKADIFVPGHGFLPRDPIDTRAGLRRNWQILKDVRAAVQEQVARGATEEASVRAIDLPQFHKYKGYQRAMEIAVRRIYRELTVGLP
jgi:glyoxylase-like metal-dependent hydrolase (beta-lactamase superfamily II)